MRQTMLRLLAAAVLLVAGDAFRRAAVIEARRADTQERLMTMPASVTPAAYDEIEEMLGIAARIPLVGDRLLDELRRERAHAAYWNGDYAAVTASRPDAAAADGPPERSPDLMFLAANASFRSTLQTRTERAALLRGLDEALQSYSDVLKLEPGHAGAGYNYEYVGRLRTALARGQRTDQVAPDGPPSMHGDEGNPPQGTKPPEFNVIVPLRPDERQEQFDAGEGGVMRRRG